MRDMARPGSGPPYYGATRTKALDESVREIGRTPVPHTRHRGYAFFTGTRYVDAVLVPLARGAVDGSAARCREPGLGDEASAGMLDRTGPNSA